MIWNSKDFARDDARNEYLCRWTWESVASATNGEGHADADAEYLLPVKKERHTLVLWCTARSQIARFFHGLACYSPITRPSKDNKRQRSPHETMRPLGV
jgi:hypothetical protein